MLDLRDRLQATLGTTYTLERELGGGGMSRVFIALDTALERRVVVKVLAPELAAGINVERFKREILVAAQLQHPHIVPVFSAGELTDPSAGTPLPYFTMPFVDGESLRARLERAGAPSIPTVVNILWDVARALDYAHRRGVVHRDIKPDNVLLAGRSATVTDFGIAKALTSARTGGDGGDRGALTQLGTALGTPAYMAPEQVAGDPSLDHRADLYALGILTYEMLTGRTPFAGASAQAMLVAHLMDAPEPVAARRPDTPPALAELVMRCLRKRPQRAADVLAVLDELAHPSGPQAPVSAPRLGAPPAVLPSIAVLPFANMSADPENEYLSDGIAEEILNSLAQLRSVRVVARTSSFAFKGARADIEEVGRKLRVSWVLEGSVRRSGDRLRITTQLVDASDGSQLWSERYDRQLADVFEVQDDIAGRVVKALKGTLLTRPLTPPRGGVPAGDAAAGSAESTPSGASVSGPVPRRQSTDPETYELYLKARYFVNLRVDGAVKGMEYFRRAVERDPAFALAHAGVAQAYQVLTLYAFLPSSDGFPASRDAAMRALELDPNLAEGHLALAAVSLFYDWDWPEARRRFERTCALNPNDPICYSLFAYYHVMLGDLDAAVELAKKGVELDPLGPSTHTSLAQVLYLARRYDEAIERCRLVNELSPAFSESHRWQAICHIALGEWDAAVEEAEQVIAISGRYPWAVFTLGVALAASGRFDEARALLAELEARAVRELIPPISFAFLHAAVGDTEMAFHWMERSYEARDFWLVMLAVEPRMDPLRGDPRFEDLVQRIGLGEAARHS
ncbi:MAG: protein kinase [Gemmatimonadaceae bacterium]